MINLKIQFDKESKSLFNDQIKEIENNINRTQQDLDKLIKNIDTLNKMDLKFNIDKI